MLNRKRIALVALAAVMTLGTVGCSGNPQLIEQLNLGEEYMASSDYENAIVAYQAAIGIDKYAWDAHSGLVLAMVESEKPQEEINIAISNAVEASMELAGTNVKGSDAEALVGFYETAMGATTNEVIVLNILIASNDVLKDNPFETEYVTKLETMAPAFIESNNYEEAQDLIDRLKESGTSADVTALEQQKEEKEAADASYVATLTKAVEYIEAGNWTAIADMESTDEIAALRERIGDVGNFSYIFTEGERAGKTIGYYSMEGCSCNEWYYGETVDGQRAGVGGQYWCMYDGDQLYVETYVGQWENDRPNGSGHYCFEYDGEVMIDEDATYVNGRKHGTYETVSIDEEGYEWTTSYTLDNGHYVEVEVEDWVSSAGDGYYYYAVAYRQEANGSTTARTWRVAEDRVVGVCHFK